MILEAVADYRLWIWHAYFVVAGSNNDLNVLNSSSLFNEQCQGVGPTISFVATATGMIWPTTWRMGYTLSGPSL